MSFEGYYQRWCAAGHYWTVECLASDYDCGATCPDCGGEPVINNCVDDTNCEAEGHIPEEWIIMTPENNLASLHDLYDKHDVKLLCGGLVFDAWQFGVCSCGDYFAMEASSGRPFRIRRHEVCRWAGTHGFGDLRAALDAGEGQDNGQ